MATLRRENHNVTEKQAQSAAKRWQGKKIAENDKYCWSYKGEPILCTFGFSLCLEIDILLQQIRPSKTEVSRLLSGENKTSGGWSVQKLE